jgi:hypothetical protein
MTSMRRTQPGYGVVVPDDVARRNIGPADDDGFTITDTRTGESRLLVSIREILERADPPVRLENPDACEIYGFHSKFNPQGTRLMLSIRAYPVTDEPRMDAFTNSRGKVRFAWVTMPPEGGDIHCAVGPEEWEKGGHHATWFPDGEHISMNLRIDRDVLRFVQVRYDGTGLSRMLDDVPGSGHPTVHADGRHVLSDTYAQEPTSFGDGTIPLRWVDLKTGDETALVRIHTLTPQQQSTHSVLRVDPHPAWDTSYQWVAFNGFVDGTRRVFVADMRGPAGG